MALLGQVGALLLTVHPIPSPLEQDRFLSFGFRSRIRHKQLKVPKWLRLEVVYLQLSFNHETESRKLAWTVRQHAFVLAEVLLKIQCLKPSETRTDSEVKFLSRFNCFFQIGIRRL